MKKGRETCSAQRREGWQNAYKDLEVESELMGSSFFQAVFSDNTRGNGHRMEQKEVHTSMRENSLILRVTEHCNSIQRGWIVSSFGDTQDSPGHSPGHSPGQPTLGNHFSNDLQRSAPTPTIVWLCKTVGIVYLIDSNVHSMCCLGHQVDYANAFSMEDA